MSHSTDTARTVEHDDNPITRPLRWCRGCDLLGTVLPVDVVADEWGMPIEIFTEPRQLCPDCGGSGFESHTGPELRARELAATTRVG